MECVVKKNYRNLLTYIKKKHVLNINPTLWNSKYAFLLLSVYKLNNASYASHILLMLVDINKANCIHYSFNSFIDSLNKSLAYFFFLHSDLLQSNKRLIGDKSKVMNLQPIRRTLVHEEKIMLKLKKHVYSIKSYFSGLKLSFSEKLYDFGWKFIVFLNFWNLYL